MIVHIKEIIKDAQKGSYAVGAFNTSNLEITLGIIKAAVAKKAPVIVQVTESSIKYAGLRPITHIVQTIAKNVAGDIPVALHLDHSKSFQSVAECIQAGFSSIHIDASELPFDENVALSRHAVVYAHRHHVWAQGELGSILGKEGMIGVDVPKNSNDYMTDPEKVKQYIKETEVDTLAVSIGTMHGYFKGKENIDHARLARIHEKTKIPLVLHGGSGASSKDITAAIKNGIRIINIDTDLRIAFTDTLKKTLQKDIKSYDPRRILTPSIDAIQKVVEERIELFGHAGKA